MIRLVKRKMIVILSQRSDVLLFASIEIDHVLAEQVFALQKTKFLVHDFVLKTQGYVTEAYCYFVLCLSLCLRLPCDFK